MDDKTKIEKALAFAESGQVDGSHHKAWAIDQIVRVLTGCPEIIVEQESQHGMPAYTCITLGESKEYKKFIKNFEKGEDGPNTYAWDIGIPP